MASRRPFFILIHSTLRNFIPGHKLEYGMLREALLTLVAAAILSQPALTQQTATAAPAAETTPTPAWETAFDARHEELIRVNGAGTDTALRDRLLKMGAEDQTVRGFFEHGKPVSNLTTKEMIHKLTETDARLTTELRQIVREKGWPTIALVGIDASNAAMLIFTHTPDHAWQRELLPQLQQLADTDKIDASSLALVIDKELVAEGKLQRYGSQFKFINGTMAMYAVEDPDTLDQRRAKVLLPPMDVYRHMMSDVYHLKATDDIVTAPAPAGK